jgi:hypothetical protein
LGFHRFKGDYTDLKTAISLNLSLFLLKVIS